MFNLDRAIATWREKLRAAGLTDPAVLDELESHLREDVAHELQSGLEAPQAFALVVERLGSGSALKVEFKKANATKQFFLYLIYGSFSVVCLFGFFAKICAEAGYHPFPHYLEAALRSDVGFLSFMVFVIVFNLRNAAVHSKQQPVISYWKLLFAWLRLSLGIFIILFFSLSCILVSGLLIYTGCLSDGVKGGLEVFPVALILFSVPCFTFYFSRKAFRSARTRFEQLHQV